jgi:surface antigen
MDAETSLSDTPQSNAFAAQARALSQTPTLEQWLQYWNDADTDFGNVTNIQHWIELARRTGSRQ